VEVKNKIKIRVKVTSAQKYFEKRKTLAISTANIGSQNSSSSNDKGVNVTVNGNSNEIVNDKEATREGGASCKSEWQAKLD